MKPLLLDLMKRSFGGLMVLLLIGTFPIMVRAQATVDTATMTAYLSQINNYIINIDSYLKINGINRSASIDAFKTNGQQALNSQFSDRLGFEAVKKYLGRTPEQLCQKNIHDKSICMAQWGIWAEQVSDIDQTLTALGQRTSQLQSLTGRAYATTTDLQVLQFQASVIQAQIQNDMMRLNLSLKAYDEKKEWYQRQLLINTQQKVRGNGIAVNFPIPPENADKRSLP